MRFVTSRGSEGRGRGASNGTAATLGRVMAVGIALFAGICFAGPSADGVSPGSGSAYSQTFTFTFSDSAGWQTLGVMDVLINSAIDGRSACYVAYVPSGANTGDGVAGG